MKIRVNLIGGGHVILDNVESVNFEGMVMHFCQIVDDWINVDHIRETLEGALTSIPETYRADVRKMYNQWHKESKSL